MSVKLLTEHHLAFVSLKGGCTGSSESTHVKMPHCWKSHVAGQFFFLALNGPCRKKKTPKTTDIVESELQKCRPLCVSAQSYLRVCYSLLGKCDSQLVSCKISIF